MEIPLISTILIIIKQNYGPAHPGELIRETIDGIAEETGKKLSVKKVATGLGTTRKTLSAIINGKQAITPEMAIKLATGFGNTTPGFRLRVQDNFNLFLARKKVDTKKIKVFWKADALRETPPTYLLRSFTELLSIEAYKKVRPLL